MSGNYKCGYLCALETSFLTGECCVTNNKSVIVVTFGCAKTILIGQNVTSASENVISFGDLLRHLSELNETVKSVIFEFPNSGEVGNRYCIIRHMTMCQQFTYHSIVIRVSHVIQ